MRLVKQPAGVAALLAALVSGGYLQSASGLADTYPKNRDIDVEHYVFRLSLGDATDEIVGETTVDVRFMVAGITELTLDLIGKESSEARFGMTVGKVELREPVARDNSAPAANEGDLRWVHRDGRLGIVLDRPSRPLELRRIVVSYSGVPATGLIIGDNMHGDRTFFSDNWPNKARNWLPVVDHPYDKATSEMIVTAPSHYQVISNGMLVEETDLADGLRRTHWRQSVPIACWLYALGVARFAVQHLGEVDGVPIQTWVYAQDRDAGFYDFAVPTIDAMEFFSTMVGPYSYEKLANVQSNSVGGGMEAATAIFYGDGSVTGERSVRWRNVIIHEIAHQWFGNSVTEADWDDVWLSEGFATYFTLLFIEHAYGRDAFVAGLESSRDRVFEFWEEDPDYRIVHDNLDDMSRVTSSQTYQKGAWTLHMLRGIIGDDAFWTGIRDYYRRHRDANATTADFRRAMEEASGRELGWFFDQWLYRGGNPVLEAAWSHDPSAGEITLDVRQVQSGEQVFRLPLEIEVRFADTTVMRTSVDLMQRRQTLTIPVQANPTELVLDPDTWVLMRVSMTRR